MRGMAGAPAAWSRNQQRLLEMLYRRGPMSLAGMTLQMGISRTTVSQLVSELRERRLLVRVPSADSPATARGRPPGLIGINPSAAAAIGINISRSLVQVALSDLDLEIKAERNHRLEHMADATAALNIATRLVEEVIVSANVPRSHVIGVGIGLPGPVDRKGNLASPTIPPGWIGTHLKEDLSRRLGFPVLVDNGSNLGALGETVRGAAVGCRHVAYVHAATGIGCGLIINGRIYRGSRGTAGELGHTVVDREGPICRCGNRGCLETRVSAEAILTLLRASHGERLEQLSRNPLEQLLQVIEWARAGDQGCRRVLGDAGRELGAAVANLCNLLNPELVVLGGALGHAGDFVITSVRESISRYTNSINAKSIEVVPGALGDQAELVGALAYVRREGDKEISSHLFPAAARTGKQIG